MLRKRAHSVRYKTTVTTGGYRDENGDWVPGTSVETEHTLKCRADVNSKAHTIKNNDGQDYVYSFSIYLDHIPDNLKKGVFIEILSKGKVVGSGSVIMPFEFQAHSRIYI